jgi:hypothetical protein
MGDMRNAYKIFFGNPERRIPLGIPRRRLEDNIRMDLRKIGWEVDCGLDSSNSGQGPIAGSCEHGNELSVSIKGRELLD